MSSGRRSTVVGIHTRIAPPARFAQAKYGIACTSIAAGPTPDSPPAATASSL